MSEGKKDAFLDIEFPAEVWLAEERVPLGRLVSLQPGEVLELGKDPDGPVQLVVSGVPVATGELVIVDGHFGFRVKTTTTQGLARAEEARHS